MYLNALMGGELISGAQVRWGEMGALEIANLSNEGACSHNRKTDPKTPDNTADNGENLLAEELRGIGISRGNISQG